MDQIAVGDKLVVDIMPSVYQVTEIASDTLFYTKDMGTEREHAFEFVGGRGGVAGKWQLRGLFKPHKIDRVTNNPLPQPTIHEIQRFVPIMPKKIPSPRASSPRVSVPIQAPYPRVPIPKIQAVAPRVPIPKIQAVAPRVPIPTIQAAAPRVPIPTIQAAAPRVPIPTQLPIIGAPRISTRTPAQAQATRPLSYDDWVEYAREQGKLLTWNQLQNLPGITEIVPQLQQIFNEEYVGTVSPELYFENNKTTIADIGKQYFYNYNGLAVLGSGADESILWSNLRDMPPISNDL